MSQSKRGDGGAKTVVIGESGRAIGKELDELSAALSGIDGPNCVFVSDDVESSGAYARSYTRLMKCAHTLTEQTDFCSVCSRNAEVLQETVLRNVLEESAVSSLSKFCVVSDNFTQFSTWASAITLEYLQQESGHSLNYDADDLLGTSKGGVISVLAKPPMGVTTGLENLYALLSAHHSLAAADCTLFRGIETCSVQLATTSTPSSINGAFGIACDLWPLLCSTDAATTSAVGLQFAGSGPLKRSAYDGYSTVHSYLAEHTAPTGDMQYHLWPVDICTHHTKIIDARSSLAALLKRLLKPKPKESTTDYNPLRSLTSNVHALHLAYTELYPHWTPHAAVTSANCANFALSSAHLAGRGGAEDHRGCLAFTDLAHSENELGVSLQWATPGVLWPYRSAKSDANSHRILPSGALESSDVRSEAGSVGESGKSQAASVRSRVGRDHHPALQLFPANAINIGARSVSRAEGDDDCSDSLTVGSISSRLGQGSWRKSSQGSVAGSVNSAHASVMSRRTQRSGASTSRDMYALSAALRQDAHSQDPGASVKEHTVSSIVFDSPYGKQDCAHICASSRRLLTMGAYRHLFGPVGSAFTSDELLDALEIVEGYCH